jgi:hypothetical protein
MPIKTITQTYTCNFCGTKYSGDTPEEFKKAEKMAIACEELQTIGDKTPIGTILKTNVKRGGNILYPIQEDAFCQRGFAIIGESRGILLNPHHYHSWKYEVWTISDVSLRDGVAYKYQTHQAYINQDQIDKLLDTPSGSSFFSGSRNFTNTLLEKLSENELLTFRGKMEKFFYNNRRALSEMSPEILGLI